MGWIREDGSIPVVRNDVVNDHYQELSREVDKTDLNHSWGDFDRNRLEPECDS
jgi:hypothetical protein